MSISWFKLNANFDKDDRVALVESNRNGGVAIYHYIKLHCIAARCNQNGGIFFADTIPHTPKTLARQWKCKEISAKNSIDLLLTAHLLELNGNVLYIADWCREQSIDKLEEMRKNARLRKQKSRERQAAEKNAVSRDNAVTVTGGHGAEEDIEKEKERDIDGDGDKSINEIVECFNTTAFGKINFLSAKQKEAVMNAINEFGAEQLKNCFTIASQSEFLKGKNHMNWVAGFDWLIKPENIAKVLNGNYANVYSDASSGYSEDTPVNDGFISSFNADEFIETALMRGFD